MAIIVETEFLATWYLHNANQPNFDPHGWILGGFLFI